MKAILFLLVSFVAITCIVSGILMISRPDGSLLQLQTELLASTPFKNYLLPGIILAAIAGGINLIAMLRILQHRSNRYNWAIAGGFMICGWIIAQILLINVIHWLHFIYLGSGILIILIAYHLKGKWAV